MVFQEKKKTVAGRLQTIWFDWKHDKSHVGLGIQSHIITDTRPSHKPTSLIPKPFFILWSMCHQLLQIPLCLSLIPPPSPLCMNVCVCMQGWVWVQAQLASSSCSALGIIVNALMNWVPIVHRQHTEQCILLVGCVVIVILCGSAADTGY